MYRRSFSVPALACSAAYHLTASVILCSHPAASPYLGFYVFKLFPDFLPLRLIAIFLWVVAKYLPQSHIFFTHFITHCWQPFHANSRASFVAVASVNFVFLVRWLPVPRCKNLTSLKSVIPICNACNTGVTLSFCLPRPYSYFPTLLSFQFVTSSLT